MLKLMKIGGLSALLLLGACASLPEQPRNFDQLGHYQQIALNDAMYRISFKTDRQLSYGNAEEITLLKAAQVTIQQGFDTFTVLNDPTNRVNQQSREMVIYRIPAMYAPYPLRPWRNDWHDPFYDAFYQPVDRIMLEPIEVSYTIQMFKKENTATNHFDARRILQSLGAKYGLNAQGQMLVPENNKRPPSGITQ